MHCILVKESYHKVIKVEWKSFNLKKHEHVMACNCNTDLECRVCY